MLIYYDNHELTQDHIGGGPIPELPGGGWSDGSLTWHIPWRYRLKGEASSGIVFATIDQHFYLSQNGDCRVTKAGIDETRSINEN